MSDVMPWKAAWDRALYGTGGFFRTQRPADHFRTSSHIGLFAEAIATLARRAEVTTIVDIGAGSGELLTALGDLLDGPTHLIAVDLSPRPVDLPHAITWTDALPDRIDGLLIANEWLDNIPCDIVELDESGTLRQVLVSVETGEETLGEPLVSTWADTWWSPQHPGERVEIGLARDQAWADAVSRVDGVALAIDYGHVGDDRPPFGSLRSYRDGREVDVIPDGRRDLTAHVAVDATASVTGATLLRQRDALLGLGLSGARPPLDQARDQPSEYLRDLARSTEAGELLGRGGLGDFWWLLTDTTRHGTLIA